MKAVNSPYYLEKLCLLFLISSILFSCHTSKGMEEEMDPLLINCWKYSYEETTSDNSKVYRPCDSMEFPPSRFRSTFIFKENNDCEYLELAPNDAHFFKNGSWEYESESRIILIKDEGNQVIQKLVVMDLTEDKLVVVEQ